MFAVSVVIPAYNEEKNISRCLDSLVNQKTNQGFEVIVVDNDSTDKTVEILEGYKNRLDLIVVLEKKRGRGSARYTGFKKASGNIIFSTDADTIVPEDWIESLLRHFSDSNIIAVSGTCKIIDQSTFKNAIFNFIQPASMKVYKFLFGHYWLSGFNFAIRKEIYDKSSGFDSGLNALEDVDLAIKINKLGKIKYVGNVAVTFSGRRYKSGLVSGLMSYITSFAKYYFLKRKDIVMDNIRY